jgi:hypothetical protein
LKNFSMPHSCTIACTAQSLFVFETSAIW